MCSKFLNKDGLLEFFNTDLMHYKNYKNLCLKHNCKSRMPGLTEIVSENMIKFCLIKNNIKCTNNSTGDLIVDNKFKYECKCFTSNGPISFGPTENWEKIIFMDAREWYNNNFKIILVNLKNIDEDWYNIKINKNEKYIDQCNQKRRPRICWNSLEEQLSTQHTKIIFDGKIEDIF